MSGAPAWIDLARRSTAAAGLQNGAGGAPTVEGSHRGENDNAGTAPSFGLSAGDRGAALLPHAAPRRRRLWPTVALILSAAAHAAAFAWIAGTLDVEGLEPASDGVAVEIVFDLHEAAASAAIAGNDGAATADAEPVAIERTVAEAVQPVGAETAEPAPPAEIAATAEVDSVAPAGQDSAEAVQPDVAEFAGQPPAQDKETVQPASAAAADPVQEAGRPDALEPSAADSDVIEGPEEAGAVEAAGAVGDAPIVEPASTADAAAAVQPVAPGVPAEAVPTAPDAVEAVSSEARPVAAVTVAPVVADTATASPLAADRPADVVVDRAEPAVAVEPETLQPAAPGVATPEPTLPAPPAFVPPAPDAATVALLATPPVTGSARQDAEDAFLPEAVTQVPAPRPEPQAAVTKPTPLKTARKEAQARAVEPDSARADAPPAPRKQDRQAKAAAASGGKPADAAARKPAAAASAGSQARTTAAPGAEVTFGRRVLSHVQRYKRYPAEARRAGISGATRLSITIDRSGGLAGARISAGSGHAILDQEALAVARRAEPYPRPPEGVGGRTFSFAVTLRFTR